MGIDTVKIAFPYCLDTCSFSQNTTLRDMGIVLNGHRFDEYRNIEYEYEFKTETVDEEKSAITLEITEVRYLYDEEDEDEVHTDEHHHYMRIETPLIFCTTSVVDIFNLLITVFSDSLDDAVFVPSEEGGGVGYIMASSKVGRVSIEIAASSSYLDGVIIRFDKMHILGAVVDVSFNHFVRMPEEYQQMLRDIIHKSEIVRKYLMEQRNTNLFRIMVNKFLKEHEHINPSFLKVKWEGSEHT